MATATKTTAKCACGNPIYPYDIAGHVFTASYCPACLQQQNEQEAEEKKASNQSSLGYQRRYAESSFDNLRDPQPPEQSIAACKVFAEQLALEKVPSGRGIYLWGPNGTGKTHLAVAITRAVKSSIFVNTLHLFDAIKDSYQSNEPCYIFERAKATKLLVLDDLGSERPTGWVQERLYALLAARWDEVLSTVVTSNIKPHELSTVIGERSASRILGSCLTIKIDGVDHRRLASAAI